SEYARAMWPYTLARRLKLLFCISTMPAALLAQSSPPPSWLAPEPLPTIPSFTPMPAAPPRAPTGTTSSTAPGTGAPVDRTEQEKKILALSSELKNPQRERRKIFSDLFNAFEVLDRTMFTDPSSRVALLPQRLGLILELERNHYWPQ